MSFEKELISIIGKKNCCVKEPMKKHITFKVGGEASYYVTPESDEQLINTIKLCRNNNVRYQLIGNGSNILFTDEGYDGVVIAVGNNMAEAVIDNNVIIVKAGAKLSVLAAKAADRSLTGLEFAAGIPGTVGGAVTMNAGAYGGEIKDVIVSATVYDVKNDKVIILGNGELELGYRQSIIQKNDYIVLEACFELTHGDKEEIQNKMKELAKKRRDKQPLSYASAGSTFKRPEGHFAGALIQECGLKGYRVGNARVSEKHAGFVVNIGGATASDILSIIEHVKETVYKEKNVLLEPEVKIIR